MDVSSGQDRAESGVLAQTRDGEVESEAEGVRDRKRETARRRGAAWVPQRAWERGHGCLSCIRGCRAYYAALC